MMKILAASILLNISFYTLACSTFMAGKEATEDGSVIIARTADGPNLEFVFQCQFHEKMTGPREFIPCEKFGDKFHYTIPSSMSYFSFPHAGSKEGQNFSFEENGINEKGVSMSATETILSSKQMLRADPLVSKGLNEDCITSVILPQIHSAREGAKMLGDMINMYGSSEGFGGCFCRRK